jgi:hypothetical protein
MCYISDLKAGQPFMVRDKRGIWMKTNVEYRWILDEAGIQAFSRTSDLNEQHNRGYLCVEIDTGETFVFTAGEKAQLAVCQL